MNFKKNSKIFFLLSLLFIFIACDNRSLKNENYKQCRTEKGIYTCETAPAETPTNFPELQGKIIQQGKVKLVIVEFFHPLCSPCQESVAHLNKLYKRNDVEIIGVTHVNEEAIKKFINDWKPEYEIRQVPKDFFKEMGIEYVPHAFIYRVSDKQILWNDHPMKITDKLLDELKK